MAAPPVADRRAARAPAEADSSPVGGPARRATIVVVDRTARRVETAARRAVAGATAPARVPLGRQLLARPVCAVLGPTGRPARGRPVAAALTGDRATAVRVGVPGVPVPTGRVEVRPPAASATQADRRAVVLRTATVVVLPAAAPPIVTVGVPGPARRTATPGDRPARAPVRGVVLRAVRDRSVTAGVRPRAGSVTVVVLPGVVVPPAVGRPTATVAGLRALSGRPDRAGALPAARVSAKDARRAVGRTGRVVVRLVVAGSVTVVVRLAVAAPTRAVGPLVAHGGPVTVVVRRAGARRTATAAGPAVAAPTATAVVRLAGTTGPRATRGVPSVRAGGRHVAPRAVRAPAPRRVPGPAPSVADLAPVRTGTA